MKNIVSIIAIFCLLTVGPSHSQAAENTDHICFSFLDVNEDGRVTLDEFETYYKDGKANFNRADVDQDGTLTHDEYHDLLGHSSQG